MTPLPMERSRAHILPGRFERGSLLVPTHDRCGPREMGALQTWVHNIMIMISSLWHTERMNPSTLPPVIGPQGKLGKARWMP